MTAGKNWSIARSLHRPIGGGLMLTETSTWRRRTGFISSERPESTKPKNPSQKTDHDKPEQDAQRARHPVSTFDLRGLHRWLASASSELTLHLVLEVGGEQPSQAWLGLSAVGASEAHAGSRLRAASEELGEALDAWALYTDLPAAPPQYPPAGQLLCSAVPLTKPPTHSSPTPDALVQALTILDRRAEPLTLCIDIPAGGLPASLVQEIDRVYKTTSRRMAGPEMQIMALFGGLSAEDATLVENAQVLWSGLLGQQVRLHLHGSIPGPLLLQPLLDSLEDLLGVDLKLNDTETEIGPATPGITINPQGLLGTLTIGASQPATSGAPSPADDIPF